MGHKFTGQSGEHHGKVRDSYFFDDDGLIAMVVSDRVSAFDVILPETIPYKGQILNQLARLSLENTADIADNWLLETPHPNVSIGHKCKPFPIEIVVRSALVGHAWRIYKEGQRILCGVKLPDGMGEYDSFENPIITPTTKAQKGHDEDISRDEILRQGLATEEELNEIYKTSYNLYDRGQKNAHDRGLQLVDTKYEFGKKDDDILVIDEVHTPDSSRFFDKSSYDDYVLDNDMPEPTHLSKEFVRQWLMENGFSGRDGQKVPKMTDDIVTTMSEQYIQLYERMTGQRFNRDNAEINDEDIIKAIEGGLARCRS